jgi:hypothetical protein
VEALHKRVSAFLRMASQSPATDQEQLKRPSKLDRDSMISTWHEIVSYMPLRAYLYSLAERFLKRAFSSCLARLELIVVYAATVGKKVK